jgi:hypothetical protein
MLRLVEDERPPSLEMLAHRPPRRRRPVVEDQSPRCPLCQRVLVLYVGRCGPRYHCDCDERRGR